MQTREQHPLHIAPAISRASAFFLGCALFASATVAAQRTILVDRSGQKSPILHLRDALAQARAGDEIVVCPGYYNLPAQTGLPGITIRGDGTGEATIESLSVTGGEIRLLDLRFQSLESTGLAQVQVQDSRLEFVKARDSFFRVTNCSLVLRQGRWEPLLRFDDCVALVTALSAAATAPGATVASWNTQLEVVGTSLPQLIVQAGSVRVSGRAQDRIQKLSCASTTLRFSGVTIDELGHQSSQVTQERPPAPVLVPTSAWIAGARSNQMKLHTTRNAGVLFLLGTVLETQATPFGTLHIDLASPWLAIPAAADALGVAGIDVDLSAVPGLRYHSLPVQALVVHASGPAILSSPWPALLR